MSKTIPDNDFLVSTTALAVSSGNHSIIGALTSEQRPWLKEIILANLHGSSDALIRVVSGARALCHVEAGPKSTVAVAFGEDGAPGLPGSGIEFVVVSAAHMHVSALAFKRNV